MAGASPSTLMLPDPSLAPFAWRLRGISNRGYSLCGLNHTIASEKIMDSFGDFMTAPLQADLRGSQRTVKIPPFPAIITHIL